MNLTMRYKAKHEKKPQILGLFFLGEGHSITIET